MDFGAFMASNYVNTTCEGFINLRLYIYLSVEYCIYIYEGRFLNDYSCFWTVFNT